MGKMPEAQNFLIPPRSSKASCIRNLRHFSQLYPTHSKSVYDPTGTILANVCREVPHMLPAKYQPNRPGGSRDEYF